MLLIGTHDSVTGEKGHGILSCLGAIFSMTQTKTISEQINAGCTYFDIRVRKTSRGWICAHGLWETKKTAEEILDEIAEKPGNKVRIIYEGNIEEAEFNGFGDYLERIIHDYPEITFLYSAIKYPWTVVSRYNSCSSKEDYVNLGVSVDSLTWLFPVPMFWKLFNLRPKFNETQYTIVDFL